MPWSAKSILVPVTLMLAMAPRLLSAAETRISSAGVPAAPGNTVTSSWPSITIPLPESEPVTQRIRSNSSSTTPRLTTPKSASVHRSAPNRPAVTLRQPTPPSREVAQRNPTSVDPTDDSRSSLRLAPPGATPRERDGKPATPAAGRTIVTTISSLMIVLGMFFVCIWFMRRGSRSSATRLPDGVLQILGRSSFAGKQQLYLVRLGNKLLLLNVSAAGSEPLAEITDASEVDRIAGLCQQNQPGSVAASFRHVLTQLSHAPPAAESVNRRDNKRRVGPATLSG